MGILHIRICFFPEITRIEFPYEHGSFACSESTFLNDLSGYILFRFLLHSKQVANKVGAVLQNTTRPFVLNSLVYLSGTTIPMEMGAEAEFLCDRLAAVRGTVCGNISLLLPHQSYSHCHLHYPVLLFLKGWPKQKSARYRKTMV